MLQAVCSMRFVVIGVWYVVWASACMRFIREWQLDRRAASKLLHAAWCPLPAACGATLVADRMLHVAEYALPIACWLVSHFGRCASSVAPRIAELDGNGGALPSPSVRRVVTCL